jgi:hypothetical protein
LRPGKHHSKACSGLRRILVNHYSRIKNAWKYREIAPQKHV